MRWNFEDGADGWGQSTAMEMGIEVDAVGGDLHGIVLPSVKFGTAFVDSPELRVEVQAGERDVLVFRIKYFGLCDVGMISLERNAAELSEDPDSRRVRIPFKVRANALDSELYYIPIWKHVTGTVHRVRFHPCIALPVVDPESSFDAVPSQYGQTFHIDWVAFTKGVLRTFPNCCVGRASSRW